ncbi:NAD(P)H-dependent oxidoreductase [Aestuariibius insulae]|uniref:NAD(P)H-dependent oxidoreductase n=1 Tax=Aestuariibius insulae TaxID=2058287 RepID=UPI00345E566E
MAQVIVYLAHPGQRYSRVNSAMVREAAQVEGITQVDLYADYPRHGVDVEREQDRLIDHDTIVLQFPFFWYSVPALLKDWIDLVLEHGFAYGDGGTQLAGKRMQLALTAGGPETSYSKDGYNRFGIRTLLTPLEQTAHLCKMEFLPPYVLYGSIEADAQTEVAEHARGYAALLKALRDDRLEIGNEEVLTAQTLRLGQGAA